MYAKKLAGVVSKGYWGIIEWKLEERIRERHKGRMEVTKNTVTGSKQRVPARRLNARREHIPRKMHGG